MEKAFIKDFEQGLGTLDDIQTLGDVTLSPLITRVHFHMCEIRRKAEESVSSLEPFIKISNYLEASVDTLFKNYLFNKFSGSQLNYQKNVKNFGLQEWEKVFTCLSPLLKVAEAMPFERRLLVQLNKNTINIKGKISGIEDIVKYRPMIYAATRKLLEAHCILTFDIKESKTFNEDDMYDLELKVDISHNDSDIYALDLSEEKELLIGFSNTFHNYKLSPTEIKKLDRHLCIEVTEDLSVEKHYRVPDRISRDLEDKEFLYFSFLFRPVSIIIPKRGKLLSINSIRHFGDTGSGHSRRQQEVGAIKKFTYRYIDFFALIND